MSISANDEHLAQAQQQFKTMPHTWQQELITAVKCLNNNLPLTLLEQIPDNKAALAREIETLTHDFRYDLILQRFKL